MATTTRSDPLADLGTMVRGVLDVALELARELHPGAWPVPAGPDSSLDRDLGLDSLSRAELLVRLERRYGVALPDQALVQAETPRDLARLLQSTGGARLPPVRAVAPAPRAPLQGKPHGARTVVEMLQWYARAAPDRPHLRLLVDEGPDETLTYGELWRLGLALAAGLQQRGVHPGDAVALMLPTSRAYFAAFVGTVLAGAVPVPLYPPARKSQLAEHLERHAGILGNCRARLLITVAEARPVARLMRARCEHLREVVTVDDLAAPPGEALLAEPPPEATALLQYTSGSTGDPKGVVLSHANLLANIRAMGQVLRVEPDDVLVSWLPLYHDMGLIGAWLGSLYHGALLVGMSPLRFLARPARWLQALSAYGGTLSAAPNFAYELCLKVQPDELADVDLSRWRAALNGAEPVSAVTLARFQQRFAPCGLRAEALMPVYGLAECAVGLCFPPPGRPPLVDRIRRRDLMQRGQAVPAAADAAHVREVVACGRPLPGHEVRVVDAAGRELPEREEGRLQFRGPSATSGYFRNPARTQELFTRDGWLESGDLGYLAQGDVYLTGRSKDLIIRAGRNLAPQELEEAVGRLPGIRKGCVAVFGCPDPGTGSERIVVLAETREKDAATLDGLRARILALSSDLLLVPADDVVLAPPHTVLKTSSGKVRRSACADLYERGRLRGGPRGAWRLWTHWLAASARTGLRRARRATAAGLYAAWAWTMVVLLAPWVWLLVLLVPGLDRRWRLARGAARLLAKATSVRVTVRGAEHLPPAAQPCVLVANHASYIDSFVLMAVLPWPVVFVAKAELQRQPWTRLLLRRLGVEFVERYEHGRAVADARHLVERARQGGRLVYFAEGGIARMPGLRPFHLGAFVAAVAGRLPVVPVTIRGSRSLLRADTWFPRRAQVAVAVGEAIPPPEGKDAWAAALQLREATRAVILAASGEPDLDRGS